MSSTNLARTGSLSPYQITILEELVAGKTQVQIAEERGIGPANISEQLAAAKAKTQTLTTYHLVYVYAQYQAFNQAADIMERSLVKNALGLSNSELDRNRRMQAFADSFRDRAAGMLP